MPRGKQSKGTCAHCGTEIAKNAVTKHLSVCLERRTIIEKAARKKTAPVSLYHLRVQAAHRREFWLDLEMRGTGALKDLDYYLRGIWLECCGHLSQFSVGGLRGDEIPMTRRVSEVFQPGLEITHIYDFGTSSETLIKAVETREGTPTTTRPVALMARNMMPEAKCIECGEPAAWLCMQCLIEQEKGATRCERHSRAHPHEDYGEPLRLVNSPRLGMCGYEGPAEPPY